MATVFFDWMDYLVFGLVLFISSLIGVYFAYFAEKKQNTTSEYLMGGKTMGVFPVSMSLIASYLSGISLLGLPSEMYVYGTQYWTVIIADIFVNITMAFVYIPVFYTLQITSSYEYLKLRFNQKVRALGSCLFIIKMLLYIPLVIYVPALAFSQVTGINLHFVTPIVCIVCIFYTTLGGLKAVVWTDTIQMAAMILGMITVIGIGISRLGLSTIWQRNIDTNRIEFDVFDIDPTIRHTIWGTLFGNYFDWLAACSVNQAMVQRCLSMPTKKKANMTILILAIGTICIISMCCFTGLIVFAYFHDCDPITTKQIKKSDQILPYFVMDVSESIPGFPGIFVSGVFSASLSTMSTGLNSMAGVIFEDFIRPIVKKPISELTASTVMKVIVVIIGAICVLLVFVVERLGALIQAGKSLAGITSGPLLGLFTLGMFFPWANSTGALVGGLTAVTSTAVLSIFSQSAIANGYITYPKKPVSVAGCDSPFHRNLTVSYPVIDKSQVAWILQISYLWYVFIGLSIVLILGLAVSYVIGFNRPHDMSRDLFTPVIWKLLPISGKEIKVKETFTEKTKL